MKKEWRWNKIRKEEGEGRAGGIWISKSKL